MYPFQDMTTKVKPDLNQVEVHPQLSHKGFPMDGAALLHSGPILTDIFDQVQAIGRGDEFTAL
jgi:hypothetical protein